MLMLLHKIIFFSVFFLINIPISFSSKDSTNIELLVYYDNIKNDTTYIENVDYAVIFFDFENDQNQLTYSDSLVSSLQDKIMSKIILLNVDTVEIICYGGINLNSFLKSFYNVNSAALYTNKSVFTINQNFEFKDQKINNLKLSIGEVDPILKIDLGIFENFSIVNLEIQTLINYDILIGSSLKFNQVYLDVAKKYSKRKLTKYLKLHFGSKTCFYLHKTEWFVRDRSSSPDWKKFEY